ncbi:MAG: hypothetical protein RI564_10590 [Gracilimonas sp.]|jgi:carotenoid 1,2-hydratase|nr:hypothetical protein [Gracilimonas sp.]
MNITTDFKDSSPAKELSADGYEWWYFDGQSKDGKLHFVIIFYQSNPFSTNKIKRTPTQDSNEIYPAISISVYKNSKPIYYSFLEYDDTAFIWDAQEMELTIGNDKFNYRPKDEQLYINIELDQKLASGHGINGTLKGIGSWANPNLIQAESTDRHTWNLLLPNMQWNVDLNVSGINQSESIKFSGQGYHDHNRGQEPMKMSFKDWYWGRYHFEEFTLVYYLMHKHNTKQMEAWVIDQKNKTVLEYIKHSGLFNHKRNSFGLNSARTIEIKNPQIYVNIQYRNKIDNGPFYQRFLGNAIINYRDKVHAAHGISEYIYPKNIHKKLFWPLIHMRLRYQEKEPHWVQKSPIMYPWTW